MSAIRRCSSSGGNGICITNNCLGLKLGWAAPPAFFNRLSKNTPLKKNFKYHWITITGIRTEDKKTYLTASNWGEKWEYLNFEEIWNDSHNVLDRIFASGLVVMKEQEKPK